ncbi:Ff.00g120310.m01.CDS01 [Fusarium sp. VM40]|nr:Ff.00g120310.m01.CDS01 [Fusarium sp. VM40]
MNSLRFARAALRARPAAIRVPLQRRTYAEAVPDKIKLSLALPHQSIYKSHDVVQVNIPAESGEMGVLANHVPSIEQLKPGLVEVVEESAGSKLFFLSGGFATVQPNSVLSINAVEGYPLEDFSAEAIRAQTAEAQKVANGSGSEQDIAEAKIELEVLETLSAHEPSATGGIRSRTSKDTLPRQTSSTLSQKELRSSAIRGFRGRKPPSRPSVAGFYPRASHGRTDRGRPSQNIRYSAGTELPPSESFVTSYLPSTDPSRTASATEKCQDAMDILEQYGISRPEGWFSDGGTGTPDQVVPTKQMLSQICHSCGNPLAFQRYCSHCGHDSCMKCTGETQGLEHRTPETSVQYQEHKGKTPRLPSQSEGLPSERSYTSRATLDRARRRKTSRFASEPVTPRTPRSIKMQSRPVSKAGQNILKPARKKTIAAPSEISTSVKNNPFFMADRGPKTEAPEPAITTRLVQVERKSKHSDCVPDRLTSKSPCVSHTQEECSDPSCKATHAGHQPTRHSIGCATRRSMGVQVFEGNDLDKIKADEGKPVGKHAPSLRDSPSRSKLQMKIGQLYHHGQDLYHSQHIMEHLSAGVKTLEDTPAEEAEDSLIDGYGLSVHSQPVADHSLSQDGTVTVKANLINHELGKDSAVPDVTESQPPNLSDYHKGDQHPSPKSHEPNDDTRGRGSHWTKPRLDTRNEVQDSREDHSGSLISQAFNAKPKLNSNEPRRGLDTSQEGDDRITPQTRRTSLSQKGRDVDPNAKSGIENWRRELSSVNRRTPLSEKEKEKKEDCLNCNPSQYSSPKEAENTVQIFAKEESLIENANKQNATVDSPLPRLKVTDVEHSLARKSVEELMAKSHQPQGTIAEEPTSSRIVSVACEQRRKDSEMSTLIYVPSPVMPYDHMCAWRARYMDLKSQIDQFELEASYPPAGKTTEGAGPSCSHPNGDIDIEGLTVVMHLRGKEDLVINTDLKEGLQEHLKQR